MKETVGSHGRKGVWAGTQHTPHTVTACHQGVLVARRYGLTSKCPREKSQAVGPGGDGGYMALSLNNGKMCFLVWNFNKHMVFVVYHEEL